MKNKTRYEEACKVFNYEQLTLEHFSFLPENQRVSMLAEHKLMTCIERANAQVKKKSVVRWIWDWLNGGQKKYFIYWWANEDDKAPSSVRFAFYGTNFVRRLTCLGSRLHFKEQKTAIEFGNDPEIVGYFNDYLL